jgi:hypothetical protein
MQKPECCAWLAVNCRILEADCSICGDINFRPNETSTVESQDRELREAMSRHLKTRHSAFQQAAGKLG